MAKKAYLRVLSGPHAGRVYTLADLSVFEIGNGNGCQIQLPDPDIAYNHARIYRKDDGWTVFDLNSDAGSYVNDIPVQKRLLAGGEILRIGMCELQFTFESPVAKSGEINPAPVEELSGAPLPEALAPIASLAEPAVSAPVAEESAMPQASTPQAPTPPDSNPEVVPGLGAGFRDTAEGKIPSPMEGIQSVLSAVEPAGVEPAGDLPLPDAVDEIGAFYPPPKKEVAQELVKHQPPQAPVEASAKPGLGAASSFLREEDAPEFKLTVVDGDERDVGRCFMVRSRGRFVIGRALDCDFVLFDAKVSRRHTEVQIAADGVTIHDLGSANGTVVNGEKIKSVVLKPGDFVRLGFTMLSLETVKEVVSEH